MTEVYILYKGNQHSNGGIKLTNPITKDGFYLARWNIYTSDKIKVGDIVKLAATDDGILKKESIVKITSLKSRVKFEDIDESCSNSYNVETWIKFIQINEFRENQIDKIIQ